MLNSRLLKKSRYIATIAACTFAFSGCGLNPQEHKNSSETAVNISPQSTGQIAMESFTEQDSLTSTLSTANEVMNNMAIQNSFNIPTASSLGKKVLGKIRSTDLLPQIDFSDSGNGFIRLFYTKQELLYKEYDTLIVKWDDIAKDTSIATKNIVSLATLKVYSSGKIEQLTITDLDNDGIASGSSQYNGQARFTYISTIGTTSEKLVMDVFAGADKDFNTDADNKIVALSWIKTIAGTTSGSATFSDADGDGFLIDKTTTIPSKVDIILYDKNPITKPFVESTTLKVRVLTNGIDSNNTITRLSGEEHRKSGRIVTISMSDFHGNPDIKPNDTAIITFAGIPGSDYGWKDSTVFVIGVLGGINNTNNNQLYELHVRKQHLAGIILSKTFDFSTTEPIKAGTNPTSGHLQMTVTYQNNKTARIVADFDKKGFMGTWTDQNGNSKTVIWDLNGNTDSN